jgi:hypothetical protein
LTEARAGVSFILAGADLDSTCLVKSAQRAEVPSPRKKAAKPTSANNQLALAA